MTLPARSQQSDRSERHFLKLAASVSGSHIFRDVEELLHISGNHDASHPKRGTRGPCHLQDLPALVQLAILEAARLMP
jgi:hypothetical protein